ncbi:exonuclease VII, large subunit [Oceanococcus atlanticus]|uniref:Exodeoxyribonuclease 7 large subunit n=1 Tax=Oceanococcus atlanticus TaxID=1317117 RepID=A0A1Y1SG75_9GAMM|nr:exodeoxyribonuclease VII large subunit [Oceanococcus atlanticus]ORE88380.1 exonuclease VII, large subunit [Oceanococcus atlanticus]
MSRFTPPATDNSPPNARSIFQVNELLDTLKHGLEMNFPPLWVEGEISNFVAARSGHWYFTLKDARAQIRCACFRNRNMGKTLPTEGQRVLVRGQPTVYTQRGDLQLIVEDVQDAGAGALHAAFEKLKRKLQDEGLFDSARKQSLPENPRCIGVVTSPAGAALHDVLSTLRRRNPLLRVILYPSLVQGAEAPAALDQALDTALRRRECDVILLTRGGGSLEDLQAFNDEALARRIAEADLPIVSAVGHEVDFSISDFVADARAATPTAAAELLSRDQAEWIRSLSRARHTLTRALQERLRMASRELGHQQARLRALSPQRRMQDRGQWLDDLSQRLQRAIDLQLRQSQRQLTTEQRALRDHSPARRIAQRHDQLSMLQSRLSRGTRQTLDQAHNRLSHTQARLGDLSPHNVLARGYSITRHNGAIVRDATLPEGSPLTIQLATGSLKATVGEKD